MDGSNKDNNDATERLRCFICDIEVQDCSYVLATCRMQNSRSRVIKKLGELVGEGYMVVISEDDVICRNCGSLFSKLDRLESEMYETRDRILHFLEQKYSLKDGELRCKDKPKLCQPPQITKSSVKSNENGSSSGNKKILEKSHLWMRCNKCKYTTRLDSFTMRHLRDAQRTFCDNCGLIYNSESQQNKKHVCDKANNVRNQENETDNFNVVIKNNTIETISLNQAQPNLPITQIPVMTPAPPFLANSNYLYFSNISSASDAISSQQLMYMPQPVNTIVSPNKITEADSNSMQKMKVKEDRSEDRKQMLTLKNDGNFEMVDIVIKKDEKETLNVDPIMFQKL
ncbi:hypothetical protein P5V15_010605 [Pogonomyrmex californicus]